MPKPRNFRMPLMLALIFSQVLHPTPSFQSKEKPQVAGSSD